MSELLEKRASEIQDLVAKFGHKKLNLVHDIAPWNHQPGNEGIWVVPLDAASRDAMADDNSTGVKFRAYLCNTPIATPYGWCGMCFGSEVIGTSNGANRPLANIIDQNDMKTNEENAALLRAAIKASKT